MMLRVKVAKRLCSRCLECERPGCMPGLVSRLLGNVLVAWPRLDDFEVTGGIIGALEACNRNAITIEVLPWPRKERKNTGSMSNIAAASASAAGSASAT